MTTQGTLLNGVFHDHTSLQIFIDTEETVDIPELNYSDNLDPGEMMGTRSQVLGFTRGPYKAEGDVTFSRRRHTYLVNKWGDGFMEKDFEIVVCYRNDDLKGLITDTIAGCRFKKNAIGSSEGNDPLKVKIDLRVAYILHNGKNPLINMVR